MAIDKALRRSDIEKKIIGDEIMLFDPNDGSVYALNSTASYIWELCDGRHTFEAIIEKLQRKYNMEKEENLRRDLNEALSYFQKSKLLIMKSQEQ